VSFLDEIAKLAPVPAGGAAAAHVVRENLKPMKSSLKQQSYLDNLETLNLDAMEKKNEVLQTF